VSSGEDKLIARFFKPLATHPGTLSLTDDTAIFAPPAGHDLVLTADAVAGGVHFFPDDPPDAIARKALRVNLSDLAAKGAKPTGFLLTLALPAGIDDAWLEKFSAGLRADAEAFACPLFGGDTIRTHGPVSISIFAFGSVPHGRMVKRSGAKAGDRIIVTGTIGDAALGLRARKEADAAKNWKLDAAMRDHLLGRYLTPQPRSALAEALQAHAGAAIDVSDGLVGDLTKLCGVSGVSAEINASSIPLSAAAQTALASNAQLIETILTGGDDYEIVGAMKPDQVPTFRARAAMADIAVTDIGVVVDGTDEPRFIGANGPLSFARKSFSHF
jgi:thiamine-monophosphate kinase